MRGVLTKKMLKTHPKNISVLLTRPIYLSSKILKEKSKKSVQIMLYSNCYWKMKFIKNWATARCKDPTNNKCAN